MENVMHVEPTGRQTRDDATQPHIFPTPATLRSNSAARSGQQRKGKRISRQTRATLARMDASPREQPRGARVSAAPIPPQVLNTEDTEHALSQTQHRQQHTRSCHVLPKPTIQNLKQRPSRLSPVPRAAARAWAARRRRCDSPKRTKTIQQQQQ